MAGLNTGVSGIAGVGQGLMQGFSQARQWHREDEQDALRKRMAGLQMDAMEQNYDFNQQHNPIRLDISRAQRDTVNENLLGERRLRGAGQVTGLVGMGDIAGANSVLLGMHQEGLLPNQITLLGQDEDGAITAGEYAGEDPTFIKWGSIDDFTKGFNAWANPKETNKRALDRNRYSIQRDPQAGLVQRDSQTGAIQQLRDPALRTQAADGSGSGAGRLTGSTKLNFVKSMVAQQFGGSIDENGNFMLPEGNRAAANRVYNLVATRLDDVNTEGELLSLTNQAIRFSGYEPLTEQDAREQAQREVGGWFSGDKIDRRTAELLDQNRQQGLDLQRAFGGDQSTPAPNTQPPIQTGIDTVFNSAPAPNTQPPSAPAPNAQNGKPRQIFTEQEYLALPPNTVFIDPTGQPRIKPQE